MSLAPLLQVRVVVRRRNSAGASIAWPAVLLVGFGLWLIYGLVIRNLPLIITNTVSLLICILTVAVLVHYRPRSERRHQPSSADIRDQECPHKPE
jgi:uncharacterized protein with PQ loop repeat